jgi:hypothetical protein
MSLPQSYFEPTVNDATKAPPRPRRLLLLSYHFPPDGAVGGTGEAGDSSARTAGVDVIMRDLTRLPPQTRAVYNGCRTTCGSIPRPRPPWLARMEAGMLQSGSLRHGARTPSYPAAGRDRPQTGRARKKSWLIHAHAALVHVSASAHGGGRRSRSEPARARQSLRRRRQPGRRTWCTTRVDVSAVARRPVRGDLRPVEAFELEHGDSTSRVWRLRSRAHGGLRFRPPAPS